MFFNGVKRMAECRSGMTKMLFVLALLVFMSSAFAQSTAESDKPQTYSEKATARENPVSTIPYETGKKPISTCENRWDSFLPILGQAACEHGYVLPRPFGISVGYMHQDQPFDVDDILVNGVDVKTPGIAVVDQVDNEESTVTLRFDAWVLPFWNVYGLVGKTKGDAEGPLAVSVAPVLPGVCALPGTNCDINTTFTLSYEADVKGVGTTVAGGYKDFFGMIDMNYTEADLDISITDATATVISSRIGWNGKLGGFTGVLWVGAMYQDIAQVLDLPIAVGDRELLVSIDQKTAEPWNYLIGGQWDINRSFAVLFEAGFGERKSQMLNATYRF
jgi:hypothetical protein